MSETESALQEETWTCSKKQQSSDQQHSIWSAVFRYSVDLKQDLKFIAGYENPFRFSQKDFSIQLHNISDVVPTFLLFFFLKDLSLTLCRNRDNIVLF